ncbi:MAG: hypothetical protein JWN48_5392 [Myxococcaceae bacterium]|nr:hypothetical protein [Myxococcaceae bacterium]
MQEPAVAVSDVRARAEPQPATIPPVRPKWLALGAVVVLIGLVLRDAWVTEDAYITLRTVDNLIHGFGLRWNIDERVQGYTHPLWMALLSVAYAVTREDFFTTIFVGVLTTLGALLWVIKLSRSATHALLAVVLLTLSRSFIEFSTSGLENPLTHLLVAVFVWLYVLRAAELRPLAFCSALIALNRSDALLVIVPALLHACFLSYRAEGLRRTARELLIGVSPYLGWEAFSLFYYGFLFPNTAYAKLNTGLPSREVTRQGVTYLLNAVAWDPPVLLGTAFGVAVAFLERRVRGMLLAVGALLYLLYVVRIGGDFMHGRFMTLPLFVAVCLVASSGLSFEQPSTLGALLAPFVLLFFHPSATEKYPISDYGHSGVADERAFYRDGLAMMMWTRSKRLPVHRLVMDGLAARASGDRVRLYGNIGLYGFYAGPHVHIVDPIALTEPLLARLPVRYDPNWRVGHYIRAIPPGYLETVAAGRCLMADKNLCEYYVKLSEVVAGPLWSLSRIGTLLKLNFRAYDHLLDRDRYRYPDLAHEALDNLATAVPDGSPWNAAGARTLGSDGIAIELPKSSHARQLSLSLDSNDSYSVELRQGSTVIETITVGVSGPGSLLRHVMPLARQTSEAGFDRIDVRPSGGDGMYSLANVRLRD